MNTTTKEMNKQQHQNNYRRGYTSALADTHHVSPAHIQTMHEALAQILARPNIHEEERQFLAGRFDAYSAFFKHRHLES